MSPWSPAHIPDLSGKTVLVTGANSGLGYETALALASHGARVVMGCRDSARCEAAVATVRSHGVSGEVEPALFDLADLDSVRDFATRFSADNPTLDLLVNNAGVMAPPRRQVTRQGFELQFGVNHLGHFALTGLLLPLICGVEESRIVAVSSFAHKMGAIDFDDLDSERRYVPYGAYGQSKLANLLFMRELDRRLRAAGARTISVGAHPGFASTQLQATGPFMGAKPVSSWIVLAGVRMIGQSPARGAEPQLYAATVPGVLGGEYYGPHRMTKGHVAPADMSARARDDQTAHRLWSLSKELTGVDIDAALAG